MKDSYHCSVSVVTETDKLLLKANVVNWQQYHIQLIVGHPRIKQLEQRIARAKSENDYRVLDMWNNDMTRMLKLLVGHAAAAEIVRIGKIRKYIDWSLTALFAASTLLYAVIPLPAALSIDVILVCALLQVALFFPSRVNYLHDVMMMGFMRGTGTLMGMQNAA